MGLKTEFKVLDIETKIYMLIKQVMDCSRKIASIKLQIKLINENGNKTNTEIYENMLDEAYLDLSNYQSEMNTLIEFLQVPFKEN